MTDVDENCECIFSDRLFETGSDKPSIAHFMVTNRGGWKLTG